MNIPGEYYLTGVHEMGCGIKLNEDNTFEFFFSYGALDRHGYGNWLLNDNSEVILNSDYENQVPFTITAEQKKSHTGIKIYFPNYNKALLNETTIKVYADNTEEEQVAGAQDNFHFNATSIDKMIVTCLFYYDNPATLIPADNSNNYFELAANQSLALVHFKNIIFKADGATLNGILHIFDDTKVMQFVK
jgi:hypothetical protein